MNHFLKLAYNHGVQQALADLEKQGAFYDDMARFVRKNYHDFVPTHSASRLPGPSRFIPQRTISEASLAREARGMADFDARAERALEELDLVSFEAKADRALQQLEEFAARRRGSLH